jgi:hypothetical protein
MGMIGHEFNTIFGIDKVLFGTGLVLWFLWQVFI